MIIVAHSDATQLGSWDDVNWEGSLSVFHVSLSLSPFVTLTHSPIMLCTVPCQTLSPTECFYEDFENYKVGIQFSTLLVHVNGLLFVVFERIVSWICTRWSSRDRNRCESLGFCGGFFSFQNSLQFFRYIHLTSAKLVYQMWRFNNRSTSNTIFCSLFDAFADIHLMFSPSKKFHQSTKQVRNKCALAELNGYSVTVVSLNSVVVALNDRVLCGLVTNRTRRKMNVIANTAPISH